VEAFRRRHRYVQMDTGSSTKYPGTKRASDEMHALFGCLRASTGLWRPAILASYELDQYIVSFGDFKMRQFALPIRW
jgi:hypothetical protein